MKGVLLRISLLTISTLVCLGIVEYVARQGLTYVTRKSVSALGGSLEADPEVLIEYTPRGRRLVPNTDVVIHNHYVSKLDVDIKTNSLGLRDPERSVRPDAGVSRVVFLGDSIVVQDYLPRDETLPVLVERELNAAAAGKYEVVNAGLSNAGIEEESLLLSEVISRLNPRLVLLSFYLNDSRPAWGYAGEIGAKRGWLRKHSIVWESIVRELEVRKWLSDSRVERFGWMALVDAVPWKTERDAFMRLVHEAPYDWGSAWQDDSWTGIEEHLISLKKLIEDNGATLAVVAMPVIYQVQAEFVEDTPQRMLADILARHQVPLLSLLPIEREHRTETLFFDWCHPNQRGNQIITGPIARFVSAQTKGKKV